MVNPHWSENSSSFKGREIIWSEQIKKKNILFSRKKSKLIHITMTFVWIALIIKFSYIQ